jgi:REP element-mobilizing transposase RayT
MSEKYKTAEKNKAYFVTFTIVEWVKVLQDDSVKMIIVEAIKYYQQNRNLVLFAYCIMPNHVHLIAQSDGEDLLSEILRDLKKFTSRAIIKKLEDDNNNESKEMLRIFKNVGEKLNRITNYKVWQDGNRPIVLYTNKFIWQKLDYIHQNAVEYGLVGNVEDYLFSSARNYAEMKSVLDVELLSLETKTVR